MDVAIAIGSPPKEHQFDLVSVDGMLVGECKNHSWREGGKVPSGKMQGTNEAVLYLAFLPAEVVRFVVMRRDVHPRRSETLADYYYRTYKHLLGGTLIFEIDTETRTLREIAA